MHLAVSNNTGSALRLGVVGVGRWGRHWARVAGQLDGARLVALCDPDRLRRSQLVQRCHEVPWYLAADDMLQREMLDAVIIAAPTSYHAPLALKALDSGRHVLVEKPLAGTVVEAERINRHKGARVMVGHLLRYHPAVLRIAQMIGSGELGEVTHIVCDRLGSREQGREETAWWALAPHDIAIMRGLLGEDPESIQASSDAAPHRHPEDSMTALLSFKRGTLGIIRVGGESPQKVRRITVVGERRSVTFSDGHLEASLVYYDAPVPIEHSAGLLPAPVHQEIIGGVEPLALQGQHFIDCLRSGRAFDSDVSEGVFVVRVLEAGTLALSTRSTVALGDPIRRQRGET